MRGCLFRLIILAAIVVAATWILTPMAADALIEGGLAAAGFQGTGTTVDATADPPPLLLTGRASHVRIQSSDVVARELRAGTFDLTLSDVDLFARTFGEADGTLGAVRLVPGSGPSVEAESASVHGPADRARVVLSLDPTQVEALVSSGVAAALGPTPAAVSLASPNRVTIQLEGRSASGVLSVQGGSVVLRSSGLGAAAIVLLQSPSSGTWRIDTLGVTTDGFELGLVVDLTHLIG